jgi:hypothetical protein
LTDLQAALLARSLFFRKRLAAALPDIEERLHEHVLERRSQVVGPFRVHLTDDPAEPILLVPIQPLDGIQLALWEDRPA